MTKSKEEKSVLIISKAKSYSDHYVLIDLDKDRQKKFNKGEKIIVTAEELDKIGQHRWLEISTEKIKEEVKDEQKDIK